MNLKEQQYVCTLAKYGNITKAAASLYISQPALSIYINNLEKNLGTPLFERAGKQFILTYAGERYVEKAWAMLHLEQEFDEELKEITGNYSGRIRIGVQIRRAPWLLPPVIAAYEREFPKVEVILEEGTMDLLEYKNQHFELDLLLCNAHEADPSMVSYPLLREELLIAVPRYHPINEKAVYVPGSPHRYLDLENLQGETLILQQPVQSIRKDADRLLAEKGVTPGKIREIRSIETAMQMVAEGLGIGFNREGYAYHMKYSKGVNYYGISGCKTSMDLLLTHRRSMPIAGYMQRMIDMLLERGRNFYHYNLY